MKKIYLLLMMLVGSMSMTFAQTLHTYSNKDYETCEGWLGTMTYTYYEDALGNYIKHGKLNIKAGVQANGWNSVESQYQGISLSYSANASFKDGWLNGPLTVTITGNKTTRHGKQTSNTTLSANYSQGLPHGTWKFVSSTNGKVESSLNITYNQGVLVGAFSCAMFNTKGQLNNEGKLIGKWTDENPFGDNEYNFINGVLITHFIRKDGRVTNSEDNTEEKMELAKQFAAGKISEDELFNDYGYGIREREMDLKMVKSILYKSMFGLCLDDIGGDKTREYGTPDELVLGKPYYELFLDHKVKSFDTEEEFNDFLVDWEVRLIDEEFEDPESENYNSFKDFTAKDMMLGYRLTDAQKEKVRALYAQYVQDIKPGKMEKIAQKQQQRAEERKRQEAQERKKIEQECAQFVEFALNKLVDISKDRAGIKIFGADIVINVDYDNHSEDWQRLFCSSSPLRDNLGKQFKEFCPVVGYRIDSVDLNQFVIYCTLEKFNKKEGSEYWQTKAYLTNKGINLDKSFIFSNAVRVRGDWDEIKDLQKSIEEGMSKINEQGGKDFSDVVSAYKSYHKGYNQKVSDNLKETIQRLTQLTKVQRSYMTFINLRKQVADKQAQIIAECGKSFSDVQKDYETFMKGYNLAISTDSIESYKRMTDLMIIQDSCLKFLSYRKNIEDNDAKIMSNKTCKNIVKAYAGYFKSADMSWSNAANASEKLSTILAIQQKIVDAVTADNASELEAKVKKLKDKSLDNILKEI
ncbi:MAG: hypothetical protein MJZ87_06270 [Bacteroidales bacterium]|nr:hypothetical protein [Bacteroidales bacterium]